MDYIEVSAKTVDDAITKASIELGLSSDQLEYQVISQGSSGFLGIGSKPAVIQVRRKPGVELPEEAAEEHPVKKEEKAEPQSAETGIAQEPEKETRKRREKKAPVPELEEEAEEEAVPQGKHIVTERTDEEISAMKTSASAFLEGVFQAMELPVNITMDYDSQAGCLDIDFEGEDMGILIGKRGQTLDSLQ